MNKKLLRNIVACATAATCAYYTGKYVERQQLEAPHTVERKFTQDAQQRVRNAFLIQCKIYFQ